MLAAACVAGGAVAAAPIVLPSPIALVQPPPPLTTGVVSPIENENELRFPGRIGNTERVVVGLREDGSASAVDVTQRLTLPAAGDYSFVIPAPVLSVVAAQGTQSEPGQRNTGIVWASAGMRMDNDIDLVRSFFSLGGFLNLSGLAPDSLVGPNFALLRGIYYRQIGDQGTGFLNVPVYVGASIEQGNVWGDRRDISFSGARTNGSVFLGLDTFLGPVYLATGFDDQGGSAYYLALGRTF